MKILLIEDEPRAGRRLRKMVEDRLPNAQIIGPEESVVNACHVMSLHPDLDLIVSDIQLSDGLSFEAFSQCKPQCPVIFTTAFDQYAIQAFKVNGIDYLLKPIQEEELHTAIDKYENGKVKTSNVQPDLESLARQLLDASASSSFKERFMVKIGEKIKSINTDEVLMLYSKDKATYLLTQEGRNYIVDFTVEELSGQLNGKHFFRVNRAFLVRHKAIKEIAAYSNSRLRLVVSFMEEEPIVVARERVGDFKKWLDS